MRQSLARHRLLPYLLLIVATASWGGTWVSARAVYPDVPPGTLTFWRWFLAGAVLLPFAASHLRADAALIKQHWWTLFGLGVLGTAAFSLLGNWGVRYTTAINATLLNGSMPFFVPVISWLLLRMTVSRGQVWGCALSLAGVIVILTRGDLEVLAKLSINPGDLLVLAGCVAWSLYAVVLKWRPPVRQLTFMFMTIAAGTVFSIPFYVGEALAGMELIATPRAITVITYLALGPSLIGYVCFNRAVQLVGPNVAGFFNPVVPMFGALFAILFLGEPPEPYHLPGFALVISGVYLTSTR